MAKAIKVTMLPPTIDRQTKAAFTEQRKKRVAAYARVSTNMEEQLTSYEAQVDYYTKHITNNPAWQLIKVYCDEGISATNTKHREGFNQMVADALAGKIDLILTKSVSRFARNTVDSLTIIRQLKEKNVFVYFEKENIDTGDAKGELLLTIMSSLAQEESRSISENVLWGKRKRMAEGQVSICYGNFLGYKKGENGKPEIVESEAEIVRLIYSCYY
jgi:DNA invertase Pin-like site-specific DNA recombinase